MGDLISLHPSAPDGGPPIPPKAPPRPKDATGRFLYDGPVYDKWAAALQRWAPAYEKRRAWEDKQRAKERAAKRAAAPHPNWASRLPSCHVAIVGPTPPPEPLRFAKQPKTRKPPPVPHHGRWEGEPLRCRQRPVAYDVTDRRAVGYLYGACVHHLEAALAADPSREWWWADARPIDADDLEAELALAVLGGMRR